MIPIKTEKEIECMREVCEIAASVLAQLCSEVKPGVTSYDLDQLGKRLIEERGAVSACYNYKAGTKCYPAYTCISVNEEVVHGIGSLKRIFKAGDIVSVDVSVMLNGFIGDNARTVIIEPVAEEVRHLVKITEEALYKGIEKARTQMRVGDISHAVQKYVEAEGFSIVRDFVGHGVGRSMHEEPQIPNFGRSDTGPKLKAGMTLAIEPMVNLGGAEVEYAEDGWTVITVDRKPSAHFEHTVLITEQSAEILTIPKKIAC